MRCLGVLLLVVAGLATMPAAAVAHPEPNDVDGDGVLNQFDNCPETRNADQRNEDGDGRAGGDLVGDRCDSDADADGWPNLLPYPEKTDKDPATDNCGLVYNPDQTRAPENPDYGDACYVDSDGDTTPDPLDNCPELANPGQADYDFDRTGDACDPDDDEDGEFDARDNCPLVYNWEQTDADGDGIGAACDDDDTPAAPPRSPPPPHAPDMRAPALRLTMARTLRLSELGRTIAVRARCSERCTLRVVLIVKRRRVAAGTAELGGAGTTYVFMRKLRRLRPARATLRLTATDAVGNKRSMSRRVKLRR